MNIFLLFFQFLICNSLNITKNILLNDIEKTNNLLSFTSYGNWCGPGHGGYQDCCNNTMCPKCDLKKGTPDSDCLDECPPIDELDYHCAIHDECCLNSPKSIVCFPEGNKCYCDCALIEGVKISTDCKGECLSYRSRLLSLFNYGLSCWYENEQNKSVCNIASMRDYQISKFCKNGNEINPWNYSF